MECLRCFGPGRGCQQTFMRTNMSHALRYGTLWGCNSGVLFAVNCVPAVIADVLLRFRVAPGVLTAFTVYFIVTEEFHWRIHLREWLLPGFRSARAHHMAHHARPNARFNIFLPLWDRLLGTSSR